MHPIRAYLEQSRADIAAVDMRDSRILSCHLLVNYAMMVASERLLREAAEELRGAQEDYDIALRAYYLRHLDEELDHAEWLNQDLAHLGVEAAAQPFDWRPASIAGMQYYLIKHVHPACLLGYLAALECLPTPMAVIEQLEAEHGARALRTLRHHAEHDPDHGDEVLHMIDAAPAQIQDLIQRNLIVTQSFLKAIDHE